MMMKDDRIPIADQGVPDGASKLSARWCVVRLDDNGNEFEVASDLTHADAAAMVAQFEASAHKQHYWVRGKRSDQGSGDR